MKYLSIHKTQDVSFSQEIILMINSSAIYFVFVVSFYPITKMSLVL